MLLTVIIPVFNACQFLNRCLDSVLTSKRDFEVEIVLVNDGSTDDSLKICESYSTKHDFISVITISNSGPSAARNIGIENANGNFICFVDSDDYVQENYFEVIFSHLHKQFDILVFSYNKISTNRLSVNAFENIIIENKQIVEMIRSSANNMRIFWYPWTKVYKSSLLKNIRFNEKIRIGEDTLFNIEAFVNTERAIIIEDCLYNYVSNDDSLTQVRFKKNLLQNMEEHFNNRLQIHEKYFQINGKDFYYDISNYYVNHILFWLLSNNNNNPNKNEIILNLREIRNSLMYEISFKYIKWQYFSIGKRILILLFKMRLFKPLMMLYKNV